MKNSVLIKIGGIYHLVCAAFHIFFPKIFQWESSLESLALEKQDLILSNLNIMNWCLLLFWLIFAYIPIFHTKEVVSTKIGKSFLTSIILFWFIRIFIFQPVFVGLDTMESIMQVIFLLIGFFIFLIPWFQFVLKKEK